MRTILYFVGAGLTKSLELPRKPVPMMYDFVSVLASYLDDDVILTTLAELEKVEPYKWKDDKARTLAKSLVGKNADRSPDNRAAFARALKNKPFESIEDLLLRAEDKPYQATRFRYAINRVFCLIGWEMNWCPLERFLSKQFSLENTSHVFVSFNYDLVLDRGIQKQGEWGVCNGYGFEISHCISTDPHAAPPGVLSTQITPLPSCSNPIRILKPHGSLNWLAPLELPYRQSPTGLIPKDESIVVPLTTAGELRYCCSTETFQWVSIGCDNPQDVSPIILPPTSAKRSSLSFLDRIEAEELEAIRNADEVYILGWSLPKTDEDQEHLISSAVEERQASVERVTVINRNGPPEYFERIACVFGVKRSQLRIFNAGFVEFVAESI